MGNDKGPLPLIPSIMLGAFGLFKYGPSLLSYLGFFVKILEGLTGGGGGDEEAEEEDLPSVLTTTFYMCALAIIPLALILLLQETNRLYKKHYPHIQRRLSSGPVAYGIRWAILLLVVVFIVLYNDLMGTNLVEFCRNFAVFA